MFGTRDKILALERQNAALEALNARLEKELAAKEDERRRALDKLLFLAGAGPLFYEPVKVEQEVEMPNNTNNIRDWARDAELEGLKSYAEAQTKRLKELFDENDVENAG